MGHRVIIFTAVTFAVIRQVTKIAAIISKRCEMFILVPVSMPVLYHMLAAEEVEHTGNDN